MGRKPLKLQVRIVYFDDSPWMAWELNIIRNGAQVRRSLAEGRTTTVEDLVEQIAEWEVLGIDVIALKHIRNKNKIVGPKPWREFNRFKHIIDDVEEEINDER